MARDGAVGGGEQEFVRIGGRVVEPAGRIGGDGAMCMDVDDGVWV